LPSATRAAISAWRAESAQNVAPRWYERDAHGVNKQQRVAFRGTGMFTGLRRGELLALSWEDVDFEQGVVFVMHATTQLLDADRTLALKDVKTGESGRRAVPLAPMVQSLLLAYRSAHPQAVNRVFFGGRGVRRYDEIWNAKTFSSALRRHLKTLGIEDVTIQRLRHAFNSLGNLAGSNEATRSGMMGHTSTRMTRTQYTTLYKEHASEAVQILESFLRQTRPKQGQEN
jgi:integrase